MDQTSDVARRKDQHLDLVLAGIGRDQATTGFEAVRFVHCALPEIDFDRIDLSTGFLGKRLAAPFLISSMTGGPSRAETINARLAEVAQDMGLALGVGSQRVALEGGAAAGIDASLRKRAPDAVILANLGAAQLVQGYGVDEAMRAVGMIGADGLIVHLNPLQEAVQPEGDRDWRGVLKAIEALVRDLGTPVIVKETGAGLSATVSRRLVEAGVVGLDVAGAGGTNWALVEGGRSSDPVAAKTAAAFAGWGIPTARAIRDVRAACPKALVIGSGGVRDGVDAAKAVRLGADVVGQAAGVLDAALTSTEAVAEHFEVLIRQLRTACFCTGSADLKALRTAELL